MVGLILGGKVGSPGWVPWVGTREIMVSPLDRLAVQPAGRVVWSVPPLPVGAWDLYSVIPSLAQALWSLFH